MQKRHFLKENLEDQNKYSSKFSEILQNMDIFDTEEHEEQKEENNDEGQDNPSNENEEAESEDQKEQSKDEETETSLDSDYDIDEYKMDEQLVDTDSDKESSEQVIQKTNLKNLNLEYTVFTNQFDEVIKAEYLDNSEESAKLRRTLDQQLIGFQDVITKLANKL